VKAEFLDKYDFLEADHYDIIDKFVGILAIKKA